MQSSSSSELVSNVLIFVRELSVLEISLIYSNGEIAPSISLPLNLRRYSSFSKLFFFLGLVIGNPFYNIASMLSVFSIISLSVS